MSSLQERAESAEEAGDFESAFGLWSRLGSETRDEAAFCRAGRAAQKLEKWAAAENAFKKAFALDPASADAMECLGSLFLNRTDGGSGANLLRAKEWLLGALRIRRTATLLTFLGNTYVKLEELSAAKEAFSDAALLDPAYEEAYFNLALLAESQNPTEARKLLEKAIELDSDYGEAHQRLGILVQREGHVLEAEYHFRRALEINHEDYWSRLYLANALAVQGRAEEAEREYRAAISMRPTEGAAFVFFANFLDALSRAQEAQEIRASRPPEVA